MSGLTVTAEEFPTLSAWLVAFMRHDPFSDAEGVAIIQQSIADAGVGARARQGLAMAIGDCMQMVANWPSETVATFNAECAEAGLPSLSDMQFRFWATIRAIQTRGHIRSEKEYYALREAVEMLTNPADAGAAWNMLSAFEEKLAARRG